MTRERVGVLISGRGLESPALIDALQAPDYPAEIVLVVSNVPGAQASPAPKRPASRRSPSTTRTSPRREDFDAALDAR